MFTNIYFSNTNPPLRTTPTLCWCVTAVRYGALWGYVTVRYVDALRCVTSVCYSSVLWCVTEVCYGALRCVTLMRCGVLRWCVTTVRYGAALHRCVTAEHYGVLHHYVTTVHDGSALQYYVTVVRYTAVCYGALRWCTTLVRYDGALHCGDDMRNGGVLRCVTLVHYAVGDDASYADALR